MNWHTAVTERRPGRSQPWGPVIDGRQAGDAAEKGQRPDKRHLRSHGGAILSYSLFLFDSKRVEHRWRVLTQATHQYDLTLSFKAQPAL